MTARVDLYWIPLGAGARVVRASGRVFEACCALLERRSRCDLYHSALIATSGGVETTIEMAPASDIGHGSAESAPSRRDADADVVGRGPVGSRPLGRLRLFQYEIRRWSGGTIPDLGSAVGGAIEITRDPRAVRSVLDTIERVPTPAWGRDELGVGEMWNSNSVISWTLATTGLIDAAGRPPVGGRAPGWDAGICAARRPVFDGVR